MTPEAWSFPSGGSTCDAWFFPAVDAGPGPKPVVVMAHGLGGTKDSGLAPFARDLAAAGLHVLAFDYRGFGASAGTPRQVVSVPDQLADYRAALAAAAALPGADPGRLVLWGVSLSGGLVVAVAADAGPDAAGSVAAVVSLVPLLDGRAAARHAVGTVPAASMARSGLRGAAGALARLVGRPPVLMPLVGRPGQAGAITVPGHYDAYLAAAGPTWRNEIGATIASDMMRFRPGRRADRLPCPWLVQIADLDRLAPPDNAARTAGRTAERAAGRARVEVRRYPCDHFDVLPGNDWYAPVVADQVAFLRRQLDLPTP